MIIYPINLNIDSFDSKIIKPTSKSSYSNGYTQKVAKYTRALNQFSFSHENLEVIEKEQLQLFFETNQGLSFTFVHPLTNDSFEVSFEMDEISFSYDKYMKTYSTKIILQEI